MRVVGALLGVLIALAAPASARAGTLELSRPIIKILPTVWVFTADSNVEDHLDVVTAADAAKFTFTDSADALTVIDHGACALGACCTRPTANSAVCPRFDGLTVNAGNDNDTVAVSSALDYNVALSGESGADALTAGGGDDTLDGGSGNDTVLSGQGGNDTLIGGSGVDSGINGGAGTDTFSYDDGRTTSVTATVGGGNTDGDQLSAATSIEILAGSDQGDVLTGTTAADSLAGNDGDDILVGRTNSDSLNGGAGRDIASYADGRTTGVTATLGGSNSDGDAYVAVEGLTGGSGADNLAGDGAANVLEGGPGQDVLRGAAGADVVNAVDGGPDSVDCGDGSDRATLDPVDTAVACEIDADGDGFDHPEDCNDANATINPGAAEIPDNGVDENCDGTLATTPVALPTAVPDGDGDSFNALLDCDDANPAIHPGAREIPGNKVDENCDRERPDFPVTNASISIFIESTKRWTRITELSVSAIPARSRVEIRCKRPPRRAKACPFKVVKRTFKKQRRKVNLTSVFKHRKLPLRTVIDVRVIVPGAIGKVRTERVVALKTKRTLGCLRPGAKQPSRCPVK